MEKVFKTQIDIKPTIIRSAIILLILPVGFTFIHSWKGFGILTLIICELILTVGILLPLNTAYKVTYDGFLIIVVGIRKIKINILDITSIKNENSWNEFISTPYVHSLDQLKLSYKKFAEITITPKDKEEFIKALQDQNPKIVFTQ